MLPAPDPYTAVGLVLGILGTVGLEPVVRDWRGRFGAWRGERRRRGRARDAADDYFFASYHYASRVDSDERQGIAIRRGEVVALRDGIEAVKVRVRPTYGRSRRARLEGSGVRLTEACDERDSTAWVYRIEFTPAMRKGERRAFTLFVYTVVHDDSSTPGAMHRVSWAPRGRRTDTLTLRVILPRLPGRAWYQQYSETDEPVGEAELLSADSLTFEVKKVVADLNPSCRHAIEWQWPEELEAAKLLEGTVP